MVEGLDEHLGRQVLRVVVVANAAQDVRVHRLDVPRVDFPIRRLAPLGGALDLRGELLDFGRKLVHSPLYINVRRVMSYYRLPKVTLCPCECGFPGTSGGSACSSPRSRSSGRRAIARPRSPRSSTGPASPSRCSTATSPAARQRSTWRCSTITSSR